MQMEPLLPDLRPNDVQVVFRDSEEGKIPIKSAHIKTETGSEALIYSGVLTGSGLQLATASERCCDTFQIRRSLERRTAELEGYQARRCVFSRSADPLSNFYTVEPPAAGTLYIRNESTRSLRFHMPDGTNYRVCANCTEALDPSNTLAQIGPLKVLLELGGTLDTHLNRVLVLERGRWHSGEAALCCGSCVDSYYLRLWHQEDCLGVLQAYSRYFLARPRLGILDLGSYGRADWYVRNVGDAPLTLFREQQSHPPVTIPNDRRIYHLGTNLCG